jgi:hypothetical protein
MRAGKYTKVTVDDKGKLTDVGFLKGSDLTAPLNEYGGTIKASRIENTDSITMQMNGVYPTFAILNGQGDGIRIDTHDLYGALFTPVILNVTQNADQFYFNEADASWRFETNVYANGLPLLVGDVVGRVKAGATGAVAVTATNGDSTAFTITYGGGAFVGTPSVTVTAIVTTNVTTNSVFAFLTAAPGTTSAACRGQRVTGGTTTGISFSWIAAYA